MKNEGVDRFLVIIKISKEIDLEKIAVHMFVLKFFYKNYNYILKNLIKVF